MPDNPRIEELRRRVQKDPASIAFAQLAEEFRRAGNYTESVEVCRVGLERHPTYLSARVTLGRALIELERFEEAKTELECVLRSAPENLAAIRGLAEIHQRHGDLGEALKQYQSALGIAKHDPEIEESVTELSRQLGTPPPDVPAIPEPVEEAAPFASVIEPPPISFDFPMTPPPVEVTTNAFASVAPPEEAAAHASPELQAAADEFTKALEALDSLSIDIPTPSLATGSLDIVPPAAHSSEPSIEAPASDDRSTAIDELPEAHGDHAIAELHAIEDAPSIEASSEIELSPALEGSPEIDVSPATEASLGIEGIPASVETPAIQEPAIVQEAATIEAASIVDASTASTDAGVAAPAKKRSVDQIVLGKLESWLNAIVLDREGRAADRA